MRALIVDDDIDTQTFLKSRLEEYCFACDTSDDGEHALSLSRINEYDIILLDFSLPKKSGYQICETLRAENNTVPIIMISGTKEVPHKVNGFRIGIDDYITKPFLFDELYARMQAVLRRPRTLEQPVLTIEDLVLDTAKQTVRRSGNHIYLTRKEFSLLEFLMRNAGSVVSRGSIMEHIWDVNLDPFSNTIETHILNLRKKIDRDSMVKLIHCVPGRGYKIDIQR